MKDDLDREELTVFASELGWMSIRMRGKAVRQLSFGHVSATAASQAIAPSQAAGIPVLGKTVEWAGLNKWQRSVIQRLQRYAEGVPVDFCDLSVDSGDVTEFHARVLKACREIPYGKTATYGELAAKAGVDRAGRAVGSVMSGNRVPLIIPCHRVVRTGGNIGRYSAPGGSAMKSQLLKMEAVVNRKS